MAPCSGCLVSARWPRPATRWRCAWPEASLQGRTPENAPGGRKQQHRAKATENASVPPPGQCGFRRQGPGAAEEAPPGSRQASCSWSGTGSVGPSSRCTCGPHVWDLGARHTARHPRLRGRCHRPLPSVWTSLLTTPPTSTWTLPLTATCVYVVATPCEQSGCRVGAKPAGGMRRGTGARPAPQSQTSRLS